MRALANAPIVKRGQRLSAADFRLAEHELEQISARLHPRRGGSHIGFDLGAAVGGDKLIASALGEQLKALSPSEIKKHPARAGVTAATLVAPELVAGRAGKLAELLGSTAGRARTFVREERAYNKGRGAAIAEAEFEERAFARSAGREPRPFSSSEKAAIVERAKAQEKTDRRIITAVFGPLAAALLFAPNYRSDLGWRPISEAPGNRLGRAIWRHR